MSAVQMEDPAESNNTTRTAVIGTFSPQVIAFALFGRVSRLSCAAGGPKKLALVSYMIIVIVLLLLQFHSIEESVPSFSDSINQVSKQFPDIPDIFRFGPSTVKFRSVGVFCRQFLNQGQRLNHAVLANRFSSTKTIDLLWICKSNADFTLVFIIPMQEQC